MFGFISGDSTLAHLLSYSVEAGSDSPQVAALMAIAENPQRATFWGRRSAENHADAQEDPMDYNALEEPSDNSPDDLGETFMEDESVDESPEVKGGD